MDTIHRKKETEILENEIFLGEIEDGKLLLYLVRKSHDEKLLEELLNYCLFERNSEANGLLKEYGESAIKKVKEIKFLKESEKEYLLSKLVKNNKN